MLPVVFADGSTAELVYPPSLDLAGEGVESWTAGHSPGIGRTIWVRFGSVEEWVGALGGAEAVAEDVGAGGRVVRLWDLFDEREQNYLLYEFGPWTVGVYDYSPLGVGPSMTDEQRALWVSSLDLRTHESGFPILEAALPLRLTPAGEHDGPELVFSNSALGDPELMLLFFPGRCQEYGSRKDNPVRVGDVVMDRSPWFASWCDPGGLMRVHVYQEAGDDYIDRIALGLEIRNVRLAS